MKLLSYLSAACTASMAAAFNPVAHQTVRQHTALFADGGSAPAEIQFVRGLTEQVVPNVRLTRARDGSSGVATFSFNSPNVFDASTAAKGEITGMFMIDEEGEISTTSVNASFANGKPQSIESTYVMTSPQEWDRFMRFMERYGEANGLGFNKA
mmetsp:Transcript_8385/g.15989  ORF Transcript_8385/g.15989 Transcript_8385/m.15989 type:complete len:154 (+) Transcript_8385:176-637(+)